MAPERERALLVAASLWHGAVGGQQRDVADHLDLSVQAVSRYGDGSLRLPLFDVLAAPSDVGATVLRGAQAYVDGQRTGATDVAHEAVMVVAEASQIVVVLSACRVEAMGEEALRRAVRMVDGAMERLAEIRVRLVRTLERLRGGR